MNCESDFEKAFTVTLSILIRFAPFLMIYTSSGQLKTIENQGELTESGHFLRAMLRGEEMPTNLPTPCPALTTPPPGQCSDSTDDCSETMCCNELGAKCFTSKLSEFANVCNRWILHVFTCFCTFFHVFSHQILVL